MEIDVVVTSFNETNFASQNLIDNLSEYKLNFDKACFQENSSDREKLASVISAFTSDSDVIWALKGGAGCTRLMPMLADLPMPKKDKIFIGYSDLTVLLNHFQKYSNMRLIHGTMANKLTTDKAIRKFKAALNKEDVIFEKRGKWLVNGKLEGEVIGGNLLVLTDMLGTFYEPDFTDKILLIEEIGEETEKIDRMFAQLRDSGKLGLIKGVILGQFTDCEGDKERQKIFEYYLKDLGCGVLYDINIGHVEDSDFIELHTPLKIDDTGIYYL